MKEAVSAYHEEARLYYNGRVPPLEEYLRITLFSSASKLMVLTSIVGMGDVATEDTFKWIAERPKILRALEIVTRIMDDLRGHKLEKKRGHFVSAVACYTKEHMDATEEEAKEVLYARVINAWKDINQECLRPTPIARPLLTLILNFTSTIHMLYLDQDNFTNSKTNLKEYIRSVIAEPLTM
ncbi:hypothetical protein MLD38_034002 [Melastoma candidum]|uniref:Uncharacterized protein n=1 Tax=Melastoma candidum TaxID=119954 RepID=A0ACB9M8C6_9MYRT|nr:hypothetical protein MLD38_034002 [Melastoma candidum]